MTDLDLDPILVRWLRDGPEEGPEHGLNRALAATRKVNQRPGWTFPRWWLPEPVADIEIRVRPSLALGLLVIATLVALLAMAAAFGGSILQKRLPGTQGQAIAYQEGSAIYMARPDGAERRELSGAVPFARLPVFSPDGQKVAFVAPSSAGAMGGRLLVVPIDGTGPPVDVSNGIEVLASDVPQMSWSPNGKSIAFSALRDGVATIFVAPSDGSHASAPITDSGANRDVPTWTPRGDWIGFREREPDGTRTRLRRVSPDGTNVQEVTTVIASDAYLSKPRWFGGTSPASYWYAPGFGSATSAYIDLGANHKNVPWVGVPGGLVDVGLPWSPDGTRLVFLTRDEGVIIADYDGTEPYNGGLRRLGPVAACWVDWSPDGNSLYGGSPDGCNGVVVIPLANPAAATRVPGSTAGIANWQPLAP